jgi:hypothetical protein
MVIMEPTSKLRPITKEEVEDHEFDRVIIDDFDTQSFET